MAGGRLLSALSELELAERSRRRFYQPGLCRFLAVRYRGFTAL
jgi:hypothetical protein